MKLKLALLPNASRNHRAKGLRLTPFDEISKGKVKELNIILKTDVQGSVEPAAPIEYP
jgi:hypothetical protein